MINVNQLKFGHFQEHLYVHILYMIHINIIYTYIWQPVTETEMSFWRNCHRKLSQWRREKWRRKFTIFGHEKLSCSTLRLLLIEISVTTALSQCHHRLCKYDLVYIALYTYIYVLSNIVIAISDNNNWPDKWYVLCNIDTGHSTSIQKVADVSGTIFSN